MAGHRRLGPHDQAQGRGHRRGEADDLRPRRVRPRPGLQPRRRCAGLDERGPERPALGGPERPPPRRAPQPFRLRASRRLRPRRPRAGVRRPGGHDEGLGPADAASRSCSAGIRAGWAACGIAATGAVSSPPRWHTRSRARPPRAGTRARASWTRADRHRPRQARGRIPSAHRVPPGLRPPASGDEPRWQVDRPRLGRRRSNGRWPIAARITRKTRSKSST